MENGFQDLSPATRQAVMNAADLLLPALTVDEVRESLSTTQKGQTANTIGNCKTVFLRDPLLKGAIRMNLLTERIDIVRDVGWRRNTSALTDTDIKYLLLYFEENYGLTSEKKIQNALAIVANENCYHPIKDCLNGLVWDKTPRIRFCLRVLRCPLLDFVAVFLYLAISFMEVNVYAEKFRKEERETRKPEESAVYRNTGILRQPDHAGSL